MVEIKQKHWLYLIILLLAIVSFFVIRPYISALLFAAAVAYLLYPLQERLSKKIPEGFSSFGIIALIFVVTIIFILYGANFLLNRISNILGLVSSGGASSQIGTYLGGSNIIQEITSKVGNYVFSMTTQIPHYVISIFIFFVSLYYFLIKGPELFEFVKEIIPLAKKKKNKLFRDIKRQVNAILYIQVLIGFAQGIIGGIGLFLLGYEYAVIGGILMGVLGFIPVIGPPLFYVPVSVLSILQGDYLGGIGLLLFGILIISTIDNIVRPFAVGKKARVHPLIVLVGLFGGVAIFGVAGILVGPILLSITITLIKDLKKLKIIKCD